MSNRKRFGSSLASDFLFPTVNKTMMTQIDVLIDIAGRLDKLFIPYMLTGSFAMNYYSEPRMTRDIDIVIELNERFEEAFIDLFKDDYYIPVDTLTKSVKEKKMFNIIHDQSVTKIDFIVRKNSDFRKTEFKRRQKITINHSIIYIVSKEDLIISKLFWYKDSKSEQQKKDIKNLLQSGYDSEYMKKWLDKCNLHPIFNGIMA